MTDPADLLALLALARGGTHTAAATALGVNHTTVARRIRGLEQATGQRLMVATSGGWELTAAGREALTAAEAVEAALALLPSKDGQARTSLRGLVRVSSTELFGVEIVAPALAEVHLAHPLVNVELISVTRPAPPYGPTADLDIGVSRPVSRRLEVRKLTTYELGLFASPSYLTALRRPLVTLADLAGHNPIYYVDSMLQVAELDLLDRLFPVRGEVLGATSVLAQQQIARAGAGVAILPVYLAGRDPGLVRILPRFASATLTYWMSGRAENLRRSEVQHIAAAIAERAAKVIVSSPERG